MGIRVPGWWGLEHEQDQVTRNMNKYDMISTYIYPHISDDNSDTMVI